MMSEEPEEGWIHCRVAALAPLPGGMVALTLPGAWDIGLPLEVVARLGIAIGTPVSLGVGDVARPGQKNRLFEVIIGEVSVWTAQAGAAITIRRPDAPPEERSVTSE